MKDQKMMMQSYQILLVQFQKLPPLLLPKPNQLQMMSKMAQMVIRLLTVPPGQKSHLARKMARKSITKRRNPDTRRE
jgi:hypothetical protein